MSQQMKYRSHAPFTKARLPLALACALTAMSFAAQADEQQEALELDLLYISGELDSPASEEGYVAKRSRSATKINSALNETPRSVSVVTEQQMEDRDVQTISSALNYSAGVQSGFYGEDNKQDWFIIRGFKQANNGLFMDGSRIFSSGFYSWQIDPYMLERVEVLKGAASVLYGQSPPGGLINMQSKRPTLDGQNEVSLSYGSYDRKQLNVDVGGQLDDSGKVLGRVVGLNRDTGTQVDDVDASRFLLAPSMTLNFNDATSLTVLASYQEDDSDPQLQFLPASGTITGNPNGKIDTDTAVGDPGYEHFKRTQMTLGYELNHRLNDTWDVQQNLRYGRMDMDLRQIYSLGYVNDYFPAEDPTKSLVARGLSYEDGHADSLSVDNRLLGFWFGDNWENTLLVGFDYQWLKIDTESPARDPSTFTGQIAPLDIYNPKHSQQTFRGVSTTYDAPVGSFALQDKQTRSDQFGYYAQNQIKLDDHWVFLLGGRYDEARTDFDNKTTDASYDVTDQKFTMSSGLAYVFDNGLTPYVSFSQFFLPVTTLNTSVTPNEPFEPQTGDQKEIGLKFQPVGYDATFSSALFELTQENVTKTLPGNIQAQIGEVRVRGIELEGQANLGNGLSMVASYTKLDPETSKSSRPAEEGRKPANVADELASLWTHYQFQGDLLRNLSIGAGVRHTSSSYGDNTETLEVPSYTILDAMVGYQLDKNVQLQLNGSNLADKEYVTACDYYCWYGNRRTVTASVTYDF